MLLSLSKVYSLAINSAHNQTTRTTTRTSQAKPSQAKPSQAKPSQDKPSVIVLGQRQHKPTNIRKANRKANRKAKPKHDDRTR